MRISLRLVVMPLAWLASAANAADIGQFKLTSTPSGAIVCHKVLDREDCLGKTPLLVDLGDTSGSSQKYIVKKLGYRSRAIYVNSSAPVGLTLEKETLWPDPQRQQDAKLRELQNAVNERLSQLVYGSQLPDDGRLEILGPNSVSHTELRQGQTGNVLRFAIAISDYALLKRLKAIGRNRNVGERHQQTLSLFREAGAYDLFDRVRRAVAKLPIDQIAFNVMYVRAGATLDFEQVQTLQRTWVSSYTTRTERVDTYVLWTETQDVTVVRDEEQTINYSLFVDRGVAPDLAGRLDQLVILTNDLPGHRTMRIEAGKQAPLPSPNRSP